MPARSTSTDEPSPDENESLVTGTVRGIDPNRVTRTVGDLVAGSGIEFQDRGEHELRGIPGRWQLLEVAG